MWRKNFSGTVYQSLESLSWAQWNRLGLYGTGKKNVFSVDIECSLLLATYACRVNGRLLEGITAWLYEYKDIINKERLANLLKRLNRPWPFRFLGALFESLSDRQWLNFINLCRRQVSGIKGKKESLLLHHPARKWRQPDPLFEKWGLVVEKLSIHKEMEPIEQIFRRNALFRYRYGIGISIRSDILYLLALSEKLKVKKERDYLTTVRLSVWLQCDLSTAYRIQKDLERGGILAPVKGRETVVMQTTWRAASDTFLLNSIPLEKGIVDWYELTQFFVEVFDLAEEVTSKMPEILLKKRLHDFQIKWCPVLLNTGFEVPPPYPRSLGPLDQYRAIDFTKVIAKTLQKMVLAIVE